MRLAIRMFLGLMLLLVVLSGCARKGITLYLIKDTDISVIKKGEASKIDGYVMSEFYLKEVLETQLEQKGD